jgi:PDZ domain-containing secreted protein
MNEEIVTKKSFLQIKSIRTSSNAFMMKLKEGDVIIALDGEMVHKSYEELSKELSQIKEKKIITLFRDGVFFNTFI